MANEILVARESFVVWQDGRPLRFRRGRTTVRSGHPILEGREQRFRPLAVDFDVAAPPRATAARRPKTASEDAPGPQG